MRENRVIYHDIRGTRTTRITRTIRVFSLEVFYIRTSTIPTRIGSRTQVCAVKIVEIYSPNAILLT